MKGHTYQQPLLELFLYVVPLLLTSLGALREPTRWLVSPDQRDERPCPKEQLQHRIPGVHTWRRKLRAMEALVLDTVLGTLLAVMLLVMVKASMGQLWRRSPHCGTGGGRWSSEVCRCPRRPGAEADHAGRMFSGPSAGTPTADRAGLLARLLSPDTGSGLLPHRGLQVHWPLFYSGWILPGAPAQSPGE